MLKLTLAYLAGALTIAGAVYAAGGRATLAAFGIGFFIAVVVAVALLSSGRRMRRAARFLISFAAALDRTSRTRPQIVKRSEALARVMEPTPERQPSPVELEVSSALMNFGMNKKQAAAAAASAVAQAPAAQFQDLFRIAVNAGKVAA
jgi:hypothetical protein